MLDEVTDCSCWPWAGFLVAWHSRSRDLPGLHTSQSPAEKDLMWSLISLPPFSPAIWSYYYKSQKMSLQGPKYHAVCSNLLPPKYSCGVFFILSFPRLQHVHFPASLCSQKGSEQTHLAIMRSLRCCLIPRVVVRKQPKTWRQQMKLRELAALMLPWKSTKLWVSHNQIPLPD